MLHISLLRTAGPAPLTAHRNTTACELRPDLTMTHMLGDLLMILARFTPSPVHPHSQSTLASHRIPRLSYCERRPRCRRHRRRCRTRIASVPRLHSWTPARLVRSRCAVLCKRERSSRNGITPGYCLSRWRADDGDAAGAVGPEQAGHRRAVPHPQAMGLERELR